MSELRGYLKKLMPYAIIVLVVVLLRIFIITPVTVSGRSMEETLHNGQIMLLDKITYRFKKIGRFDIVVIKTDDEPLIKRVIGLPGEEVYLRDGNVYINGKKLKQNFDYNKDDDDFILEDLGYVKIPKGMYFVLGDNRGASSDSRVVGLIEKKDILGKTKLRIWPLNKIAIK